MRRIELHANIIAALQNSHSPGISNKTLARCLALTRHGRDVPVVEHAGLLAVREVEHTPILPNISGLVDVVGCTVVRDGLFKWVFVDCALFRLQPVRFSACSQLRLGSFRRDLLLRREAKRGACLRVMEHADVVVLIHRHAPARDAAACSYRSIIRRVACGALRWNLLAYRASLWLFCAFIAFSCSFGANAFSSPILFFSVCSGVSGLSFR